MDYDHKKLEDKWTKKWAKEGIYKTPKDATPENKYYILPQLPYPSGSGLHVGHAEVYTSCDIFARYQRMQGKKVLQVIGWDSFGLPAENYAIKSNVHPRITTEKAIENFTYQINRMGVSVDWDKSVGSHEPRYYKWTQWFFLLMYERGLAYRKNQKVNWCPSCMTVLANEQVVDGKCERCSSVVEQREMEQWYLKITEYADRLDKDLDKVDWPEESKIRQRNWIGKSQGINIHYEVEGLDDKLTVFTTTPVNFGATFIVVAPEHEMVGKLTTKENKKEVEAYVKKSINKTDLERQKDEKEKTGVFTGSYAINHVNGEKIPIWVADFVLGSVGTGAVQGCPAHDERDFDFAKKYKLPIIRVVEGPNGETEKFVDPEKEKVEKAKVGHVVEGAMINSDFLNGLSFDEAMQKTMDYFVEKGWGERVVNYKLRDWSVSRQRFWGAPIPMVYDPKGKIHPVDKADLPVKLPEDVDFVPTGRSPLTYSDTFHKEAEEKYGKGWKREVDTLDTFMCSSWYYFRYLDPNNDKEFASPEALKAWMPVDFYIGGPEHVNGHLLYARFFTKVLFDAGYIDFDEPFMFHRHQGTILGEDNRKMSKRWGNVINPTDVMDRHGGDTLRMYEMFMGPLEDTKPWDTKGEAGVYRFLKKVWGMQDKVDAKVESEEQERQINKLIKKVGSDIEALSFNTSIAKFMEFSNFLMKEEKINRSVWEKFLLTMAPFAAFLTEELWEKLGNKFSIHAQAWPEYDEKLAQDETLKIAVQINSKARDEVEVTLDESEESVKNRVLEQEKVKANLAGKKIKKFIYVSGRIVNIVI
jgi:leucyl-tRNA synthetase